jgi:hypothetical protein
MEEAYVELTRRMRTLNFLYFYLFITFFFEGWKSYN